jgi:hypothetical protein
MIKLIRHNESLNNIQAVMPSHHQGWMPFYLQGIQSASTCNFQGIVEIPFASSPLLANGYELRFL